MHPRPDGAGATRDPSASPLLRITGLQMRYPTRRRSRDGAADIHALDGLTLDIARGEFVALVGPSGCGKTTLLKILAGLIDGYGGRVTLDGRPITKPSLEIGVVFQEPTLLPWRTILDNVLFPVELVDL